MDVAQPIAQKTTVREVLGSTPCFTASFAAIVKTFEDGFFWIFTSLLFLTMYSSFHYLLSKMLNNMCDINVFIDSFQFKKYLCNLRKWIKIIIIIIIILYQLQTSFFPFFNSRKEINILINNGKWSFGVAHTRSIMAKKACSDKSIKLICEKCLFRADIRIMLCLIKICWSSNTIFLRT